MNTELLKRWVAALRSGEYKQGRGSLKQFDCDAGAMRYCCLGVLRELEPSIPKCPFAKEILDTEVLNALMGGNIRQDYLAMRNDEGKDFPYIADYIERKYINNEEDKT